MTDTGYRRRGGYDYDIAMEIGLNASIVLDKIAYFLSEKQKMYVRKKIVKYSKQLTKIANHEIG